MRQRRSRALVHQSTSYTGTLPRVLDATHRKCVCEGMKRVALASRRTKGGYQRRNFTLRAETARLLDRLPREVNRSELVDRAIQKFAQDGGRAMLRKLLEEGYQARATRDLRMVEEWFTVDEEAWEHATRARRARR